MIDNTRPSDAREELTIEELQAALEAADAADAPAIAERIARLLAATLEPDQGTDS